MKIGVDLGGSHIGVGLIDGSSLVEAKDKILERKDRIDIESTIINSITNMANELCKENNIDISDIELIGIASPRNYFKWSNYKSGEFRTT